MKLLLSFDGPFSQQMQSVHACQLPRALSDLVDAWRFGQFWVNLLEAHSVFNSMDYLARKERKDFHQCIDIKR